jgi:hypothetical protein
MARSLLALEEAAKMTPAATVPKPAPTKRRFETDFLRDRAFGSGQNRAQQEEQKERKGGHAPMLKLQCARVARRN